MAEGKKSFVLYANYIDLLDGYDEDGEHIEGMTDEEAGKWIKTIFRYVNDLNPVIPNEIKQAFILVRKDLKQDLKKYHAKVISMENARKSNRNHNENKLKSNSNQLEINSDNVNDNDNDNDNDIVCDKSHTNNICACEEAQISKLQRLLNELQMLYGRCLTMMEQAQVETLSKNYDEDLIMDEIKNNLDKANPIAYVMKKIQNTRNTQFNKGYDDNEFLEDEWLKGFYERNR